MSVVTTIPTLETDRLILRAHRVEDLGDTVTFFATGRSHFVGGPMDEGDCWRAMMRGAGHWLPIARASRLVYRHPKVGEAA